MGQQIIPTGVFRVSILPFAKDKNPIIAAIRPLISRISGGAGTVEIIDGYEIRGGGKIEQCKPHELQYLIESGQYTIIN